METEESVQFPTEFWGVCCESGKKYSQVVQKKFHVTKAVLESPAKGTSEIVSLMVERADCQYLLCHLKPDSLLQADLNLYFDKGEKISFLIKGRGKIHLSGYHIYSKNDLSESSELSNSSSLIQKDHENKKKIEKSNFKSTVQDSPDESSAEEEESEEESSKKPFKGNSNSLIQKDNVNKNKIEKSNFKFTSQDSSDEDSSEEEESSKKPTKKVVAISAKKTFHDNKKNAKVSKIDEESDEDPFEDLEESSDESGEEEVIKKNEGAKKVQMGKRLWSSLSQDAEDEDEDSDESESDEDEDSSKAKAKSFQEKKKVKKDSPITSSSKSTPNVQMKSSKIISLDDDSSALNSSIGKTPMPKKKKSLNANQANLSSPKLIPQKVNFASADAEQSVSDSDKKTSVSASPIKKEDLNITVPLSESKKKKKKKKKSVEQVNNSDIMEKDTPKSGKAGLSSASYSQKLPGGLEYEDVRVGNGPIAKKGRLVHVYYTGMLENNKVFDSCESNSRPFSFKLGAQQVISGWELGIEGMKVGGKRRLKIPAHLGYKNRKMGTIPPNSTLYFNVELKAVS